MPTPPKRPTKPSPRRRRAARPQLDVRIPVALRGRLAALAEARQARLSDIVRFALWAYVNRQPKS